jgi:drug/metabolite transporter (DMT)-like permease
MFAALLALAASGSWGVGDFLGGLKSRTLHPLAVLAVSQPVGLVAVGILVAARATGPPGFAVAWSCLAAAFGTIGLVAFYRGMASGSITLVAPVVGAAAVIPVVFGLATGDTTSSLQQVGFVAAIAGVVFTSLERGVGGPRWASGTGPAIVGLLGFGAYFVFMHAASTDDFLWPAFLFRIVSTSLVWIAVLALRPNVRAASGHLTVLVAVGLLDTGGNTFFAAASTRGPVSVTSVLASLYPVVTVLLARRTLGERVQRTQEVGVALTIAGVVLVAAG